MLLSITTWWQHLEAFEKILWGIAITFSSLYLLQNMLSLSGGDTDHGDGHADTSGDHDDGSHYHFFTIKNMIAFFVMFGWAGIAAYSSGIGKTGTVLLALAGGTVIVVLMAVILGSMSRLRHSGTLEIENAINLTGSTYLLIPANRGGIGKVHIKVQGSLRELDAMTDDDTAIATGALVRVKRIINERILLVTLAETDLPFRI